jgi:hypothetical protein
VIRDDVDEHLEVEPVRVDDQAVEAVEGAVVRLHREVVGHVVPVVVLWRGIERVEPDAVHAEAPQIRELRTHTGQIADTVAVGVLEAADVHLIDDRAAPPAGSVPGARRGDHRNQSLADQPFADPVITIPSGSRRVCTASVHAHYLLAGTPAYR